MASQLRLSRKIFVLFLCWVFNWADVNGQGGGDRFLLIEKENHGGIRKRQIMGQEVTVNGKVFSMLQEIKPGSDPNEQCYVNIGVYTSESAEVGLPGAEVTVVSVIDYNTTDTGYTVNFGGYSRGITNTNGQVCLVMLCYDIDTAFGVAYVATENERLFTPLTRKDIPNLPSTIKDIKPIANNEELAFLGSTTGPVEGKTGPLYTYHEKHLCDTNGLSDYHFVFSYLSIPDELTETPVPTISSEPIPDTRTWYYGLTKRDRQTCYFKLKIRVASSQVKVELRSMNPNTLQSYGTFISGPKNDPDSQDKTLKVACLQFRCPTLMVDRNDTMDTLVEGKITVPGKPEGCTVRSTHLTGIEADELGFSATLYTGHNYGPKEGIFKHTDTMFSRARCFAGRDFLGNSYSMAFDDNNALEYDCT